MRTGPLLLAAIGALSLAARAEAILVGQIDDFEDRTTQNWMNGIFSPNPPVYIPDGGPLGLDDGYLENVSIGGFGPGSRQIMFNQTQWTGDYLAAGVTGIDAMLRADPGGDALFMRVAMQGTPGDWYLSTVPLIVPNDGDWHAVSFDLTAAGMMGIQGTALTLDEVLSNVTELRLISSQFGITFMGDEIAATLGADNITAVPAPGVLALLGLASLLGRRRRRAG